jgi:chorismate mutase/prephenate dehydratase
VFRELDSGVRALVAPLRVAFLGPEFSYSHLATIARYGQSCELVPVATIAAVFTEVNQGSVDYGLVPIENSTDGRIADTLDMFTRLPVRICGEVQMEIHHNLLGRGARAQLREVCSKPQALSQCRAWLARHLPQAAVISTESTTAAAQRAAGDPRVAAIASRQAGIHYGLGVLAANIEDNRGNVTRFAVIGLEPGERTGQDKTSLMFELSHQPGALADAMAVFKRNRLNLTWIESFPKTGSSNEYLFFVEFEGHQKDLLARRAIAALGRKSVRVEVLGSYAKTNPIR